MTDSRNIWSQDDRPIIAASLPSFGENGVMFAIHEWVFERFERNGEMASIPYLRAIKDGSAYEAPLVAWAWVQFDEQGTSHE